MHLSRRDSHSLLVCFATDTVTEHVASVDTRESQVTFNSHHLINSVKTSIRCVQREYKIQNSPYQQRGKNEKEKLFPNFRQLLGLFFRGQSDLLHQTDKRKKNKTKKDNRQLLSIIFFCLVFLSLLFRRNFDFCCIINLWLSHSHL